MIQIRKIVLITEERLQQLCTLLIDAVEDGTSLGFLAPLKKETAAAYWRSVAERLQSGLVLLAAEENGRILGTVQLAPCPKENGRHRAEIRKLCVLRSHRGKRVGSQLMRAAEEHARDLGITLLVLDTHQGRPAETIYTHLGWQRAGVIPGFAATPDGELHGTVFFYKQLAPKRNADTPSVTSNARTAP